jgi:UDP-N-acetylglucosamine:LPS N-acetylglucosamine transferase
MKRILILTAGFGDGHNAAARNIREALELNSDEVQVEVLDLFDSSYGVLNTVLKKTYQGLVRFAPSLWAGVYSVFDSPALFDRQMQGMSGLRNTLATVLHQAEPDCVVSTYPVYAHLIQHIYRDHAERPFRLITVVTDSITICSAWFRAPSDVFCAPNEATADALVRGGVAPDRVKALGFPVSPQFAEGPKEALAVPAENGGRKVLYVINTGKKKSGKAIDRLLEIPGLRLTITVGRDAELKASLEKRAREYGDRVRLLGWTNQMPQLLMAHHLLVAKAGGALVQEAIAARCPMIINQVIPGQEEGNAELIQKNKIGMVAEGGKEMVRSVAEAFAHKGRLWQQWRANLERISNPDASLRIADLILDQCGAGNRGYRTVKLFDGAPARSNGSGPAILPRSAVSMLLCDFHIHTNYSDGKMALPDVIDFYGRRGFDCICVTDHIADPKRMIGRFSELINFTLNRSQLDEYFEVIERERCRAWRKYGMFVMAGLEFNKEGFRKKASAHLLGVDLKGPINPALEIPEIIARIHAQGGLAVAAHPHVMKSEWGKNTLYLWENQDLFAPIIDAWEIANRNNIFTPVGLKRYAYIGNSDFHKPKHIYSWKTLLACEKDVEAIKQCIRNNEHVAITLYRDGLSGVSLRANAPRAVADDLPRVAFADAPFKFAAPA